MIKHLSILSLSLLFSCITITHAESCVGCCVAPAKKANEMSVSRTTSISSSDAIEISSDIICNGSVTVHGQLRTDDQNIGIGLGALASNGGAENVAIGSQALGQNNSGIGNSAFGSGTLQSNTAGRGNTALGVNALVQLIDGAYNTALGAGAGVELRGNDTNNIDIGHVGFAGDNNTIRVGNSGHNRLFFMSDGMNLLGLQQQPVGGSVSVLTIDTAGANTGNVGYGVLPTQCGCGSAIQELRDQIAALEERVQALSSLY